METGVIFDIKKYAIHDGPGIRTTVFFKGCPLSCWWCHNPEGLTMSTQRLYIKERCIGCGECIKVCPQEANSLSSRGVITDQSKCIKCRTCAQACPSEAIEFIGKTSTVDDVVRKIERDIIFYDESNGGVTFSGGEPLMQPGFLLELLDACGKLEIHRTVDTAGYADAKILMSVAERTELFIYDVKHMDPEKHKKYTGVSNEQILSNLELLAGHGANIKVRIPVIPGFNNDNENIDRTGSFISSLPGVSSVNLLKYHDSAITKYKKIGVKYLLKNVSPSSEHELKSIKKRLRKYGLKVKIGG